MILERLQEAVNAARAAGATDVEVSFAGRTLGMTRFASSALTQAGVVVEQQTRVRVALGRRLGAATTSGLDAAALAAAARSALANARQSPEQDSFAGFARPAAAAPVAPAFASATAELGPADRAAVLAPIFARAARDGLVCAGAFVSGPRRRAVATAAGVALEHELTEAALSLIAIGGDASGFAGWAGSDVSRLDGAALAEEACGKAVRGRDPLELAPGEYDVVLSPAAVSELLEWMAMGSFSARAYLDGTSLLSGRRDQPICDERIGIVDDVAYPHPDAVPWPFDSEGAPRTRIALIDRGRAGPPVSDLATAAKLGEPTTGHASPFGIELGESPIPANLVLLPGDDTVDGLVARVERGLLVTRFHYVNGLLDTRRATMTGMTRDGTFLIEDGRVGRAVRNLRFTESILDALGRVGGVGRDLAAVPTHWLMVGNYLCPPVLFRHFHFTGKSR